MSDAVDGAVEKIKVSFDLSLRPLAQADLSRNFLGLLSQLSAIGQVSTSFFRQRLESTVNNRHIHLLVLHDERLDVIVGFGAVLLEPKFIRRTGIVGHIEDMVIDHSLRRKGLGRRLLEALKSYAQVNGCYKVIVDCKSDNSCFYSSCGFQRKGTCLTTYFDEPPACPVEIRCIQKEIHESFNERLTFRCLQAEDYDKGYLELLAQLSTVGEISKEAFAARFQELERNARHFTIVIEDILQKQIVGTATLFIEQKFIRSGGFAGHVEDVVVSSSTRGQGLGKAIIKKLVALSKAAGCYKILLDCDDNNVAFYEKCGFSKGHSTEYMAQYF